MVVVLELRHREEVVPIVLSLIDKNPQVLVKFLIYMFGLPISLRVPCCGGSALDPEEVVKFPCECSSELGAAV